MVICTRCWLTLRESVGWWMPPQSQVGGKFALSRVNFSASERGFLRNNRSISWGDRRAYSLFPA